MAPSAIETESNAASEASVPQVGMECGLINLYQKEDSRGRTSWSDKLPDNLEEAAENETTARYAILVGKFPQIVNVSLLAFVSFP
jgi:hypothetical protein